MIFPVTLEGLDRAAEANLRGDELLYYRRIRQELINQGLAMNLLLAKLDEYIRKTMKYEELNVVVLRRDT